MSNPWAQLVDVYGQGIDRQIALEKSRMETEAGLPDYFMRGFFEAQKNRMAQQQANAEMELKKAHAQYYRGSEQRDRETARKNSIKERDDLQDAYHRAVDAYNRRAPGDENNATLENEIRILEGRMGRAGIPIDKPFVAPRGKQIEKPGVPAGAENPDLGTWLNQPKPRVTGVEDILGVPGVKGPKIQETAPPASGPLPMYPTKPNEPPQYEPWKGTDVRNQEGKLANTEQRTKDRAAEASMRHQDRLKQIEATKDSNEARIKSREADRELRRELAEAANELRAKGIAISGGHLKLAQDALDWRKKHTKDPREAEALTILRAKLDAPLFKMSATPEKMAELLDDIKDSLGMNSPGGEEESAPAPTTPKKKPVAPKPGTKKPVGALTPVKPNK
jgi:hypothetical protein